MSYKIYEKQSSVVYVGAFNPNNFLPERLKVFNILTDEECDNAVVEYNQESLFVKFSWVELYATSERLIIQLDNEGNRHLYKDLVLSLISLFETTMVKAVGINGQYWATITDKRNWNKLGDTLLPKDVWRDALGGTDSHIGTLTAKVTVNKFISKPVNGNLNIELRPVLENERHFQKRAFLVSFNGHFDIDKESIGVARKAVEENFDKLNDEYESYLSKLVNGALK